MCCRHEFLSVFYGSEVDVSPNLVQGDTSHRQYTAGFYRAGGDPVGNNLVKTRQIYVRPNTPFGVSTQQWRKCDVKIQLCLSNWL